MLDMGFIPDIEEICTKLPPSRQTLLFSATMPPPIKKLADKFLSNPKTIEVARPASTNINITQYVVPVKGSAFDKRDVLRRLLGAEDVRTAIIFCNRKTTVRELNKSLQRHGFASSEIHGDMDQPARLAELDRFKRGDVNILVASDVAARGLDIKGVSHVYNFDAPWHPDDYVHRIGRTGRAGATGSAYTLVGPDDQENLDNIEKLTGQKIQRLGELPAAPARDEGRGDRGRPARRRGRDRDERPARAEAPRSETSRAETALAEGRAEEARRDRRPRREEVRRDEPRRDEWRGERRDGYRGRDRQRDDGPDDGWNGPVPDFLSVALTQ
jgi:superfamily II DNA/RNA helicase